MGDWDWDWEHEERGEKEMKENRRWLMGEGKVLGRAVEEENRGEKKNEGK